MVYNTQNNWLYELSIVRYSKELENPTFRNLCLLPSSGERRDRPTLLGLLESLRLAPFKGPNRAHVSFLSAEDGNRSSFRNVVFFVT
jgi:hypothetical protein